MSVRPVLLGLYEKYFLPLQKLLLPSLQAFIIGLLPGLEEGSEIYDRWVSAVLCLTSPLCKNLGKSAEMHEAGQSAEVAGGVHFCGPLCLTKYVFWEYLHVQVRRPESLRESHSPQ